jgi:hypothetical protein
LTIVVSTGSTHSLAMSQRAGLTAKTPPFSGNHPAPHVGRRRPLSERVAQSVEHLTFNQGVLGSSPSALTNRNKMSLQEGWLGRRGEAPELPFEKRSESNCGAIFEVRPDNLDAHRQARG